MAVVASSDAPVSMSSTLRSAGSDSETAAAVAAAMVVSLAETLHLVPHAGNGNLDRSRVLAAFDAFAGEGVGVAASTLVRSSYTPESVARAGTALIEAVEQSPMPDREWGALSDELGDALLSRLTSSSVVSVRRYRGAQRPTPDPVAVRLHHLALLVSYLSGSYNSFGIRRWFERPRHALDGRSPTELLTGEWSPDDPDVRAVTGLAASLMHPIAA